MDEPENVKETKQELIQTAKGLPPTEVFSFKPRTFDEAFRFANLIAESSLIPKEFQKSPANVLVAVQLGMELGVSPMQALQNIYVVNGRPSIFGDLLPAIVIGSGLLEEFVEEGDAKEARCTVKRKGLAAITRTFSWEEAVKAGLPGRNPTYNSYPKRMLQMRARAYAMRDMFSDVLKGVAIKEDIEDIEPRDVTQAPEPIKTPRALPEKGKEDEPKPAKRLAEPSKAGEKKGAKLVSVFNTSDNSVRDERFDANKQEARDRASTTTEPGKATTAPSGEKSQEDIIAECLLWIENCSDEDLNADDSWLFKQLKGVKGTENQLTVLRPFNERRQKVLIGAK